VPLNPSRTKREAKSLGQVRIIAGSFRGRKLPVVDIGGLRPTGDRMRETLFNWLQTRVAGSRCLDLFAGTGALGIEAVSRGAKAVTLVEKDATAAAVLAEVCATWPHDQRLALKRCSAEDFLAENLNVGDRTSSKRYSSEDATANVSGNTLDSELHRFDIVFVDPPFGASLQIPMLEKLAAGHLANGAVVYVEAPGDIELGSQLPAGFTVTKHRQYGDVGAWLLEFDH